MQKVSTRKDIISLLLVYFFILGTAVFGDDQRSIPLDAFIMVENSVATKDTLRDQIDWLCGTIIENLLIPGDRLVVWTYPGQPQPLIDLEISSEDQKEGLKRTVETLVPTDKVADFPKAVRSLVREAEKRSRPGLIHYVAISGSFVMANSQGDTYMLPPETAELLRYSRVEDHPGWKTIIIGVGIREKVKKAAESFRR